MEANLEYSLSNIFGIPFYGKYGIQIGLVFLVIWTVVYASIVLFAKLLDKCKKKPANRTNVSSSSSSSFSTDEKNHIMSNGGPSSRVAAGPADGDFHENGGPSSSSPIGNGFIEDPSKHTVPLNWEQLSEQRMLQKSKDFYEFMCQRRSVRTFSTEKVPRKIIENIIMTAGTSPSGANQQPWTFVLVEDAEKKATIRQIVEAQEMVNYKSRMAERWVEALRHLNVNWIKPYLTDAPYILLVFKQTHSIAEDGIKQVHYYSELGVSISTGLLLAAIHNAGLVSVVSTPMSCGRALSKLLERPSEERLLFIMPIGYPAIDCTVPAIKRKPLEKIYIHH